MRKYDTIPNIKKEYQKIYEDYSVDVWQGGNALRIYICDVLIGSVFYVFEYEFKYKWNLKDVRRYR